MATVGDTFAESANTSLAAHTPTGPNAGTSWVAEEITGAVVAQALIAGTCGPTANEGDDRVIYTIRPNPATADVDVTATRSTVDTGSSIRPAFLVARLADVSNYYSAGGYAAAAAADAKIFKKVGGTVTELASADTGWANGDVLKFEVRNGAKKLFKNGVEILSTADNAITAAGRAGLGFGNAWNPTDDISGAERVDDFFFVEVAGGPVVLAGLIESASTATAALTVTVNTSLAGLIASTSAATADLTVEVSTALAGTVTGASTAAADLTVRRELSGTIASASTATAALTALLVITGDVTSTSTATADLIATRELSGAVASSSTVSADLTASLAIAGVIASASTATAALTVQANTALAGVVASASTATADLTLVGDVTLAGTVASESTATADLTVEAATALAGVVASTSAATADLTVRHSLAGAVASTSTTTADLSIVLGLSALVASFSATAAALTATRALEGVIASSSTSAADLSLFLSLAGVLASESVAEANLTAPGSHLLRGTLESISTVTANLLVTSDLLFIPGVPSWESTPQPSAWR